MKLNDHADPVSTMWQSDLLPFVAVQAAIGGLFLGSYMVLGFEPTVVIILSVLLVQVAQP